MLHYAAACGLGLLAGAAFAWIWLRIVPRGTNRRFWSAMSGLTREILQVEETSVFLRLYGRLARMLGPYLARNLGGMVLGCLPMIAILLTIAPMVFESWDARADPPMTTRTAYCSSPGYCMTFASLGFEVVQSRQDVPYRVVRAEHGDVNPLWPFLNDLEAAFFLAFILSTLVGLLWPSRKPSSSPAITPSSG